MQCARSKLSVIATISVLVCILAISATTYTKQHSSGETPKSPSSSSSARIGPSIPTEQIPPPRRQHAQSLHPGVLHHHPRTPAHFPTPTTAANPPPYPSELKHGHFHRHGESRISKNDETSQPTRQAQRHRVALTLRPPASPVPPSSSIPSTLQRSSTAATSSETLPRTLPTNTPPSTSSAAASPLSTPQTPTQLSPSPSPSPSPPRTLTPIHTLHSPPDTPWYTNRTFINDPISTPALVGLTLYSLACLDLLLYLLWVVVWREGIGRLLGG